MGDFLLKVSTDDLIKQASLVRTNVQNIKNRIEYIQQKIMGSSYYWEGEASNLHKNKYTSLEPQLKDSIDRLEKYPDDLLKMAGLYAQSESENTQTANELQSNIIS